MPTFEIEQFELHTMKYRTHADSVAEAIAKLLRGDAKVMGGGLEYIDIAENDGLPVNQLPELAAQLKARGVMISGQVIPSIRSVREVEATTTAARWRARRR